MSRLHHLTMTATAVLLVLTLAVSGDPGPTTPGASSWGSSFAIRDPDPAFWRPQPGDIPRSPRPYSVGISSLVAMTRIAVAPGDDLELTNFWASGALVLESGALVLTGAEGLVGLQRAGESAGLEPAPIEPGAMLMRRDRITFRSSATVALRNPEATTATLLLTTELPQLPRSPGGIVQ